MLRLTATLFLVAFFLIFVPSPSRAIKPRPSIELKFSYRHLSENETRIVLTALAHVAAKKVSISLERPLGLRLIEGEEHWEGPMKRGEQQKIQLIVQQGMSDSYEIIGKATIHPMQGGLFRQERRLILDRSGGESILNHRAPIRHKGPGGHILEFRE